MATYGHEGGYAFNEDQRGGHHPDAKESEMAKVPPLKKKTMTLYQLQMRTLSVLRKVRFQFNRAAHEDGMSDSEFIESVLEPLETDIYQDRQMLKMRRTPPHD